MKPSLAGGALAVVLLIARVIVYSTFFTVYHSAVGAHARVVAERNNNTELGP
jgi:hypothetical protein